MVIGDEQGLLADITVVSYPNCFESKSYWQQYQANLNS